MDTTTRKAEAPDKQEKTKMERKIVKRPYFNQEYQMWGVEFNVLSGEFSGKNTDWNATEAEAQRVFDKLIARGYTGWTLCATQPSA